MKYIYLSFLQMLTINLILTTQVSFLKKNITVQFNLTNSTIIPTDSDEPSVYQGYCLMKINNIFYDLTPLASYNQSFSYKTFTPTGEQINFNICGQNSQSICSNRNSLVISKVKCVKYAGDYEEDRTWKLSKNVLNRSVLSLELPSGEICKKNGSNPILFKTFYEFTCDQNKTLEINKLSTFNASSCTNTIRMNSKYACPGEKFRAWYKQFGVPKKSIAVALILIGIYFLVFGNFLPKVNGFIINFAIQGLIYYSFLNIFTPVNLMICMVLGLIVAIAASFVQEVAPISLGVVIGFILGNLSYNIFVKFIPINPQTLYWGLIILFIVNFSVLGGFIQENMVVVASSLVGGYSFVRGISVFAGNYPDESYVMKLLNHGEYTQFGRVYGSHIYAYMSAILLTAAVGILIQIYLMPVQQEIASNSEDKTGKDEKNSKDQNVTTQAHLDEKTGGEKNENLKKDDREINKNSDELEKLNKEKDHQ